MSQLPFSATWIAKTLKLPVPGGDLSFSAFSTDTRKVNPTEFFVAIKGDTFDGHDFLDAAVKAGVKGVLCQKGRAPQGAAFVAEVDDVVAAFRQLASAWRTELALPVVAIAGAVGKTTTKEFLAACLRGKHGEVLRTEGSFNGFVGIPITLLNLRREHKAAVIEIGIDAIGAMKQHIEVVKPDALVVTAIAEEHLENLIDLATVAREELIGMAWVESKGGHTVFNLDDSWIEKEFRRKGWKKARTASLKGKPGTVNYTYGATDGQTLTIKSEKGTFPLTLPLPGNHNAQNLLLAVAVSQSLGLTADEISRGLKTFEGPKGRSEVHRLPNGVTVLADYYNASPASMRASLKLFDELAKPRTGKRWLFLGDMRSWASTSSICTLASAPTSNSSNRAGWCSLGR